MEEVLVPIFFFLVIGSCILVPVYLKNRLFEKQLDTVARAIEKGIDPDKIKIGLPVRDRGDANGNWKAGLILIGIGAAFFLLFFLRAFVGEAGDMHDLLPAVFVGAILVVIGGTLLYIHKTVVGRVVRLDELSGNGAGAAKSSAYNNDIDASS